MSHNTDDRFRLMHFGCWLKTFISPEHILTVDCFNLAYGKPVDGKVHYVQEKSLHLSFGRVTAHYIIKLKTLWEVSMQISQELWE